MGLDVSKCLHAVLKYSIFGNDPNRTSLVSFYCLRGDLSDKSIIHSIESMVIEWSHQIHEVLKRDSSAPLLDDENPMPHVELAFWNNRSAQFLVITDIKTNIFSNHHNLYLS